MYFKIFFISLLIIAPVGYVALRNVEDTLPQVSGQVAADLIVCLAFSDDRVDRAVALLREGYGKKIVATTSETYAALLQHQVGKDQLVLLAPDAQTTYQEGLLLNRFLQNSPPEKILVVSDAIHLFRVKWTLSQSIKNASHHFWYISCELPRSLSSWRGDGYNLRGIFYEFSAIAYYWFAHGLFSIEDNPLWIESAKKQLFSDRWKTRNSLVYENSLRTHF
ncbi:MAG: YdcF family protein [Proteobacteria bacterium]|nr:YdcF family protein [Pseudomonadota bacterium]